MTFKKILVFLFFYFIGIYFIGLLIGDSIDRENNFTDKINTYYKEGK